MGGVGPRGSAGRMLGIGMVGAQAKVATSVAVTKAAAAGIGTQAAATTVVTKETANVATGAMQIELLVSIGALQIGRLLATERPVPVLRATHGLCLNQRIGCRPRPCLSRCPVTGKRRCRLDFRLA